MKFSSSRFPAFLVAAILFIPHASAQVVEIPDPNLRRAIRDALTLPDETSITQQEMLRLKRLKANEAHIENITGLEYAINLESLVLSVNEIQDITPLTNLVDLTFLLLAGNPIDGLSPLANLTKLTYLNLAGVPIKDLTPLANLTRLKELQLGHCRHITDITPLSNLTQLTLLTLSSNQIVNVSPLANLTALKGLWIERNLIVDISPLANLTALKELHLAKNQVVDVSPLANLTQLTDLTIANNSITDFRPLFGLNLQSVDVDIHKSQELASSDVAIPDPNLRQAIREALTLPDETSITQQEMLRLKRLKANEAHIENITGLEYAINLDFLAFAVNEIQDINPLAGLTNLDSLILRNNPIADISPLANLTKLTYLNLAGVPIKNLTPLANLTRLKELQLGHCRYIIDITPLSNLTQLTLLTLSNNQIVNVSPLASLTALKTLHIERNKIIDFSPLQGLSLTNFTYDEVCLIPDPPFQDRIQNRSLPSIVQAWGNGILNRPTLSGVDRLVHHDLYWTGTPFGVHFLPTPQGYQIIGYLDRARAKREELLAKNPNMLFLSEIRLRDAHLHHQYPEDFPYWLRDENGNLLQNWHESSGRAKHDRYLLDFRQPGMQDIIVEQAIAVAKCGLYDGIMFDSWIENGITLKNRYTDPPAYYSTREKEWQARLSIIQRIRANIPDDFLILCNSNRRKLPLSAPYINGNFMETFPSYLEKGYTRDDIIEIETNLIWLEENLREPQINCLRGHGIATESPDSPNNRRWMRLFTTMSLTLSNGYALYVTGIRDQYQFHFWYPFWDADLGQPIGPTAQRYQNVEGLYIREFANGWAVYNRSGVAQTITLPAPAAPVSDRGSNAASLTHLLPDLDGEIYLKAKNPADVNGDGKINILDLVQVANGFGKSAPDPNGDGTVNILDLVFVTQQFSQ